MSQNDLINEIERNKETYGILSYEITLLEDKKIAVSLKTKSGCTNLAVNYINSLNTQFPGLFISGSSREVG